MTSSSYDYIALAHGGWARLCDPNHTISPDTVADFEAAGMSPENLAWIRTNEAMPERERVILDIADELVRAWSRYICGFNLGYQPEPELERFISLPLESFWSSVQSDLKAFEISREELELLIESSISTAQAPDSTYGARRVQQIGHLARLCRKPFQQGPDLQPSRVPLNPSPPTRETAVALAEPQASIET
jgi:hypothetical protein